jgi:hypothetical protein
MDIQKLAVISLIKAAISGNAEKLPVGFDIESAFNTAKAHQITSMLYYGAVNCGVDRNLPFMKMLFPELCKCIAVCEKQKFETESVLKAFSEKGIDHMPLKGSLLRGMYPQPEMRLMSDADILIKDGQYENIRPIMQELGFAQGAESNHEYIWKKSGVVIELHKRLIPSYNKDYFAYYGDGWKLAIPSENKPHRYEMSNEDQMIYLFTHFAKHYRSGGIGLRHITDLYVYLNHVGNMDEDYIAKELEKLGLYEFYVNITNTINVWFSGASANEKTDLITEVIFESGVYGLASQRRIAETVTLGRSDSKVKNLKLQRMIQMVFPSPENMKLRYKFLTKAPFLLPVAWIMRFFRILFFKGEKAKRYYDAMKNISSQDITDYKQVLHSVGLDFNFEE